MLPEAFLNRMRQMLGSEYEEFLAAAQGERHQALRLNSLKTGRNGKTVSEAFNGVAEQELAEGLRKSRLMPVPWAENGYYYEAGLQPGKHPFHEAGLYYIQEPSAMAPAELLEVRPGDRVLDLCAAPGGKSTQLAAKLKGRGLLLANEIHPARAKILSENVERMGIQNACVTNEAPGDLCRIFAEYFDRILVDAPCSGEGMFRKNEAACEEWSPENVMLCADRQDEILDQAALMLRPGGRLVYSTCTFSEEENEGSVERFLRRHQDFRLVPAAVERAGLTDCGGRLEGTVRLMPHRIRGEGHFAAVLEREGTAPGAEEGNAVPAGQGKNAAGGTVNTGFRQPSRQELEDYLSFCRENLKYAPEAEGNRSGRDGECRLRQRGGAGYIRFGDNLYLAPKELPDMKGIKILRPGLHLGELKKNRFEPSHALALALSPDEAVHILNLSAEDPTVFAYLNGQSFSAAGEKGWYLICVDGFSLGWGKLAGGMMKNHYPKGLRRNLAQP